MNDSTLLKISVIMSVIGLIGLFFLSQTIEMDMSYIGNLTTADSGSMVRLIGIVEGIAEKDGNVFFSLKDESGEIDVVIFARNKIERNFTDGNGIELTGTVDEYEDALEIIAKEIKILL